MLSTLFALASTTATEATKTIDPVALIIGIALVVMALVLIVAVLFQSSKDGSGLSSAISGGSADTFFSKSKAATRDKILSKITLIVSIIFAVLVVAMYIYVSSK